MNVVCVQERGRKNDEVDRRRERKEKANEVIRVRVGESKGRE